MKIIERTDKEYMAELQEMYQNEIKPSLDEGMSLTKVFMKLNIHCGKTARKYRELRQMAIDDGYQLRRIK